MTLKIDKFALKVHFNGELGTYAWPNIRKTLFKKLKYLLYSARGLNYTQFLVNISIKLKIGDKLNLKLKMCLKISYVPRYRSYIYI